MYSKSKDLRSCYQIRDESIQGQTIVNLSQILSQRLIGFRRKSTVNLRTLLKELQAKFWTLITLDIKNAWGTSPYIVNRIQSYLSKRCIVLEAESDTKLILNNNLLDHSGLYYVIRYCNSRRVTNEERCHHAIREQLTWREIEEKPEFLVHTLKKRILETYFKYSFKGVISKDLDRQQT